MKRNVHQLVEDLVTADIDDDKHIRIASFIIISQKFKLLLFLLLLLLHQFDRCIRILTIAMMLLVQKFEIWRRLAD